MSRARSRRPRSRPHRNATPSARARGVLQATTPRSKHRLLWRAALQHGTEAGRGGRDALAAGNGGVNGDNCSFDGYVNSPYAIGATGEDDVPWYAEQCAAQAAGASSSNDARGIATTDPGGGCTAEHGGTSAAAPLAAGIFALALGARPDLGWRDLLWLTARTARWIGPLDDPGWTTNGAGFRHHPYRGFVLLDTGALDEAARRPGRSRSGPPRPSRSSSASPLAARGWRRPSPCRPARTRAL